MKRFILILIAGLTLITGHTKAQNSCGMQLGGTPAFCDTFDAPANGGTRSGDLNSVIWGVSRTSGFVNFGQQQYNEWAPVHLKRCDGSSPSVMAPADVLICNGQLREASNDDPSGVFDTGGGVTVLAMYPKQPFDWAGRTGTVSFDVSNDTHGTHAAWPEFWITDTPVPAPFTHLGGWFAFPSNAIGIRFAAQALPGQFGRCPSFPQTTRWTVDSAVIVRNGVYEDKGDFTFGTPSNPPLNIQYLDCVLSSPDNSGLLNHVEVRVAQNQIDVYATDAGTVAPLKHIAVITNVNLQFSRGLVWLEDVHYNADKGNPPSQREHTFVWDNLAFDGPFTYNDLSYDALDALTPGSDAGSMNLGKPSNAGATASWGVLGMPANPQAQAVRVLFNLFHYTAPQNITVTVNGHPHPTAWPFPEQTFLSWRTLAVTIPITDLIPGTNTVLLGSPDQSVVTSNVNIVLVNAGSQQVQPPVITSSLTANGSQGQPFSYQITATNSPTSYNATGLPTGLAVNVNTGLISGTPTTSGMFAVNISATNSGGTGAAGLTLTLAAPPPVCESVVRVNGVIKYIDQASSFCNGAHN